MIRIPLLLFLVSLFFNSHSQVLPTHGLIASYNFNLNANDGTSSGLNGQVNGAVLAADRFNVPNQAYFFNGSANIDISSNILRNNEYTYAVWIKPTTLPSNNELHTILSIGANGGDQLIAINNSYSGFTDNRPKFDMPNFIGNYQSGQYLLSDELIEQNSWYFLTFVRSTDSLKVYVNGIKSASVFSTGVSPYYAGSNAKIGSRFNGLQGFKGVIDELYIYDRPLTDSEILSIKKLGETFDTSSTKNITDLSLASNQINQKIDIDADIETKLVLKNQSQTTATNIKVYVNTPYIYPFVRYVNSDANSGNFDINSGVWSISQLAGGDSVTLNLKYHPNGSGIWYLESEVFSVDQEDSDSSPRNFVQTEDDFIRTCVSVPIKVTTANFVGRQIVIEDQNISNITWKKDGSIIPNQNSNSLLITSIGSYSFESPSFVCPAQGCCPFIFEIGANPNQCCEPLEYILSKGVNFAQNNQRLEIFGNDSNMEDADVASIVPNNNYGQNDMMDPYAWTQNGILNVKRNFIKFDLSDIPNNVTIDSAILTLSFSQKLIDLFSIVNGHSGDNVIEINRVLGTWSENTITWNNMPSFTTLNKIIVPKATNPKQNYVIDVKPLLQDILNTNNFGFLIKHQDESPYKITAFSTSESSNPSLRPKLNVYYH